MSEFDPADLEPIVREMAAVAIEGLRAEDRPLMLDDKGLAKWLTVSRRTVWRLVSVGELPQPIRIGRSTRWRATDIEDIVGQWEPGGEIELLEQGNSKVADGE